jgi:hypothetical protein
MGAWEKILIVYMLVSVVCAPFIGAILYGITVETDD